MNEQTSKERVLQVYPGSHIADDRGRVCVVGGGVVLGVATTVGDGEEDSAWDDAWANVSKLPSSPAGASEPQTLGTCDNLSVMAPGHWPFTPHKKTAECYNFKPVASTALDAIPEPLGADISGPKGSGGAAPEAKCANCRDYEANIRGWIEQLGGNPDVQHISLELERLIDAVASSAQPSAPIAPAAQEPDETSPDEQVIHTLGQQLATAQELIRELVRVLKMAKRLGHLGFQIGVDDAHGHRLSQWKEQEGAILAAIDAALARAERKEGEAK